MLRKLANEKEWESRFKNYVESGMSINGWCRKNGFATSTFHKWVKKFKNATSNNEKTEFVEIVKPCIRENSLLPQDNLSLNYRNFRLEIVEGFNPDTLKQLLKVLESL